MRLLWKLLLFSILVAILPLSIAGWKIIARVQDELIYTSVSAKLETIASDLAYRVDQMYVREWLNTLRTVGKAEQITLLGVGGSNDPLPPLEAAVEEQDDIVALQFFPSVGGRHVLTLRGSLAAKVDSAASVRQSLDSLVMHDQSAALAAVSRGEIYIGRPYHVAPFSGRYVTVGIQWETPSAKPGALLANVSLARLAEDVERSRFGARGYAYIIDPDGDIVTRPEAAAKEKSLVSPVVDSVEAILKPAAEASASVGRGVAVAPPSVSTEFDAGDGQSWRVAYAVCQYVPWGVLVQEPRKDALLPVYQIMRDIVLWLVVGLVLAVAGALALSRMIGKPIQKLTAGAREIGAGNFTHQIVLRSHDELGELARVFNHMANELHAYDELNVDKLIREKTKTETVLHNIADGVIVTGTDGEVAVLNQPAERWFGVSESDAIGQPVAKALPVKGLAELIDETTDDADMKLHTRELTVENPGQIRPLLLQGHAMRVQTQRGDFIGITTVLRDVTNEREVNRMKTELVSVVAHELRSPLVSIMGFSGILLEENLEMSTRFEFARIINEESNRMVEMINKFLDISRIESGKTEVVKVPTDLVEIVKQVVDINRGHADAKNIAVEVKAPSRTTPISIDPDLVGQAVLNLFTNAIKYSPVDTKVEVLVAEHNDTMEISVRDEGYGISEDAQTNLFQKFYRVEDDPKVRDIAGTGLGLSLVKEIVDHHGGTVHVESELGKGSTFTIMLPKRWT